MAEVVVLIFSVVVIVVVVFDVGMRKLVKAKTVAKLPESCFPLNYRKQD